MTKPELTLNQIKQTPKMTERTARVSDFLSKDEVRELRLSNAMGRKKRRRFSDVDAMEAEIVARFGYDTYLAWQNGEIGAKLMTKWVMAERARDSAILSGLEVILANGLAGCATPLGKGKKNKPHANMFKALKQEIKIAKGEQ